MIYNDRGAPCVGEYACLVNKQVGARLTRFRRRNDQLPAQLSGDIFNRLKIIEVTNRGRKRRSPSFFKSWGSYAGTEMHIDLFDITLAQKGPITIGAFGYEIINQYINLD